MNMKVGCRCLLVVATVSLFACGIQQAKPKPVHVEDVLTSYLSSLTPPSPGDLANAMQLTIGQPTLTSGFSISGNTAVLTYQVAPNQWGITRLTLRAQADKNDAHETSATLDISFDKTYCLKPDNFPAQVELKLHKMMMPIPDGGGAYEVDTYQSPIQHGRWLTMNSQTRQSCAGSVSLIKFYSASEVGPLMTAVIPSDLDTPFSAHPPYTALEFWQKLMALIRLRYGYIAPEEFEQAFGLKAMPITADFKTGTRRELHARRDWYFSLNYEVTVPGYKSVQPGVIPNGQASTVTIEIPTFTFLNKSGEFECLETSPIETDLLGTGWIATSSKMVLFNQISTTYKLPGRDSNISVFAQKQVDHYCVLEIRIAGGLSAAQGLH